METEQSRSAVSKTVDIILEQQLLIYDQQSHLNYVAQQHKAEYRQGLELKQQLAAVEGSFWWRATKPLRILSRAAKKILKAIPGVRSIYGLLLVLRYGKPPAAGQSGGNDGENDKEVRADRLWEISDEERTRQINCRFSRDIKFSILIPLYNTPEDYLEQLLDSIINQTYPNWEICFADGSSRGSRRIRRVCQSVPQEHRGKIRYKKLKKNLGISGNSNECVKMATGDYFALLDHDDALHPSALFENMRAICSGDGVGADDGTSPGTVGADFIYSDECKFREYKKDAFDPFFKPDYAPDTLRGYNYISHFTVFSRELLDRVCASGEAPAFRDEFDGSQDYDLILRLTERAKKVAHIPKVLYFWRFCVTSAASSVTVKNYAYDAAARALDEHLMRVGLKGKAEYTAIRGRYRIKYELTAEPLISIIIPNMDNFSILNKCILSILNKTTYQNYEIVIVENNSREPETFEYYRRLKENERIKLLTFDAGGAFNYSSINNYAVSRVSGEYIVLLNNDTEVIHGNWLEDMLMFAQRPDVGAVGAMLYYPDETIQHAGAILGMGGVAGHIHYMDGTRRGDCGYFGRLITPQNLTCVTAACMMMRKAVFTQVGGLNEEFVLAFNDIDLCMRIRQAGYLIVWTPYAELYHHESKTRGYEDTPEKQKRFQNEVLLFMKIWEKELKAGDPYYNENLSLDRSDFAMK